MYPIIIYENNKTQLQQIKKTIHNYLLFHNEDFEIILATSDCNEVVEYLSQYKIAHGIFLLDTTQGVELAEFVKKVTPISKIIFTTEYIENVSSIILQKITEPLGVITKHQALDNFSNDLLNMLILAKEHYNKLRIDNKQNFIFSSQTKTFFIDIRDILFIETTKTPHKLMLHTKKKQYEFNGSLKIILKNYTYLMQINRSCIINLENVKNINHCNRTVLFMNGNIRLYSKRNGKNLKKISKNNTYL